MTSPQTATGLAARVDEQALLPQRGLFFHAGSRAERVSVCSQAQVYKSTSITQPFNRVQGLVISADASRRLLSSLPDN